MLKFKSVLSGIIVIGVLLLAVGIYAGTEVPDVIEMNNPAYEEHEKGIVQFSHKKHIEEFEAGCGECHHNDKGEPLNDLKEGDDVQNCLECHKIPSEKPKAKKGEKKIKLTKEQKLEYHAEALHYNCRDCHKAFNKKNKTKAAPTTCKKCHPKTK